MEGKQNENFISLCRWNVNRIVDEEAITLLRALIKKHNINEVIAEIEEPKRKQAVELMYGMYKDQLIAIR